MGLAATICSEHIIFLCLAAILWIVDFLPAYRISAPRNTLKFYFLLLSIMAKAYDFVLAFVSFNMAGFKMGKMKQLGPPQEKKIKV